MCGSRATVFFIATTGFPESADLGSLKGESVPVLDHPLDDFPFVELHGLGECSGEVDVPLLAGLPLDELNLGWVSHLALLSVSSYMTR